jgi:hypothetical protein
VIPRTPFIVPYRLVDNTIQILRIFHGARRWSSVNNGQGVERESVFGLLAVLRLQDFGV